MAINSFKLTDTGVTPEKIDQAAAYNFTNTNSTFAGVGGEGIDETKAYNFSNTSSTFAGLIDANKLYTGTISDSVHAERQAIPNAHHTKTTDAAEITSGTFDSARIDQTATYNFTNTASTFAGTVKKIRYGAWADKPASPEVGDMYFDTQLGYLCICASAGTWFYVQLAP